MRAIRLVPVFVAGVLALAASPAVAGTAPPSASPEDQAAADNAVATFTEMATGAGFVSVGPGQDGDLLGIAGTGEDGDPSGLCFGDLGALIDPADGRFVGETARATSDEFGIVGEGATTDVFGQTGSEDSLDGAVVFGDDAAVEGFATIVERFTDDEFERCLVDLAESTATANTEGFEMDLQYDIEPLDVGDGGAMLTGAVQANYGDQDFSFGFSGAFAQAGDALVVVSYDYGAEPGSDFDIVEAVEAMVDDLS